LMALVCAYVTVSGSIYAKAPLARVYIAYACAGLRPVIYFAPAGAGLSW